MNQKRLTTLKFLAQPTDINFGGHVHGGTVMEWIDQAGYVCASSWSETYCVTVHLGDLRFISPIQIGDLVEVEAKIIYTGRTSMHILVEVHSSNPRDHKRDKTSTCIIIFVSVDEKGTPKVVPKWKPTTKEDLCLENYAKKSMEFRKAMEKDLMSCLLNDD